MQSFANHVNHLCMSVLDNLRYIRSGMYRLHGNIVNYQSNCHNLPHNVVHIFQRYMLQTYRLKLNTPKITNPEYFIVRLCLIADTL